MTKFNECVSSNIENNNMHIPPVKIIAEITSTPEIWVTLESSGPKGDAFKFEDFTPEQLEELKGDDYILTEEDKIEIAGMVQHITKEQISSLFLESEVENNG